LGYFLNNEKLFAMPTYELIKWPGWRCGV